jgi:hypothetical protein
VPFHKLRVIGGATGLTAFESYAPPKKKIVLALIIQNEKVLILHTIKKNALTPLIIPPFDYVRSSLLRMNGGMHGASLLSMPREHFECIGYKANGGTGAHCVRELRSPKKENRLNFLSRFLFKNTFCYLGQSVISVYQTLRFHV